MERLLGLGGERIQAAAYDCGERGEESSYVKKFRGLRACVDEVLPLREITRLSMMKTMSSRIWNESSRGRGRW